MIILAREECLNVIRTPVNIAIAIRNYHAGRAAVVDKTIEREFQKNRGLAFRQSAKGSASGDKRSEYVARKGLPHIKARPSSSQLWRRHGTPKSRGKWSGRSDTRPSGLVDRRDNREKFKGFAHTKYASRERDSKAGGSRWESDGSSHVSGVRGSEEYYKRSRTEELVRKAWQKEGESELSRGMGRAENLRRDERSEDKSTKDRFSERTPETVAPTAWDSSGNGRVSKGRNNWTKEDFYNRKSRSDSEKAPAFPYPNQRRLDIVGSEQSSLNGVYTRYRPESVSDTEATRTGTLRVTYTTPASQFLFGTHAVEAALRQTRRKLYKLYIQFRENRKDKNAERDAHMALMAKKRGVEVIRAAPEMDPLLNKMSGGGVHQGYVLEVSPLPQLPVESLGHLKVNDEHEEDAFEVVIDTQTKEDAEINGTHNVLPARKNVLRKPLVLYLDKIVDTNNMGAIIRSAAFLGVSAIAISNHSAPLTNPAVMKTSAGAAEGMTFLQVRKPARFLQDSRSAGWKVYCAIAPPRTGDTSKPKPIPVDELDDPLVDDPVILVLGSEGEGIPQSLLSKADEQVYIRGRGPAAGLDSLNVSVAAGILCSTINKRGKMARRPKRQLLEPLEVEDEDEAVSEGTEERGYSRSDEDLERQVNEEDAKIDDFKSPLF